MRSFVGPEAELPVVMLKRYALLTEEMPDVALTGRVCLDIARIAYFTALQERVNPVLFELDDLAGNVWTWRVDGLRSVLRQWVGRT